MSMIRLAANWNEQRYIYFIFISVRCSAVWFTVYRFDVNFKIILSIVREKMEKKKKKWIMK